MALGSTQGTPCSLISWRLGSTRPMMKVTFPSFMQPFMETSKWCASWNSVGPTCSTGPQKMKISSSWPSSIIRSKFSFICWGQEIITISPSATTQEIQSCITPVRKDTFKLLLICSPLGPIWHRRMTMAKLLSLLLSKTTKGKLLSFSSSREPTELIWIKMVKPLLSLPNWMAKRI